jgi:hypothetical protein
LFEVAITRAAKRTLTIINKLQEFALQQAGNHRNRAAGRRGAR